MFYFEVVVGSGEMEDGSLKFEDCSEFSAFINVSN